MDSRAFRVGESGVAASLCHRSPKWSRSFRGFLDELDFGGGEGVEAVDAGVDLALQGGGGGGGECGVRRQSGAATALS